jgi:hypothetical protein
MLLRSRVVNFELVFMLANIVTFIAFTVTNYEALKLLSVGMLPFSFGMFIRRTSRPRGNYRRRAA